MSEVKVHGYSDDNIEVEGALNEEFGWYPDGDDDRRYLMFSDGTILECAWDNNGIWRFTRVQEGMADFQRDINPVTEEETDRYSDIVTLTGYIKWVKLLKKLPEGKVDRLSMIESAIYKASRYAFEDSEESTGISRDDILYLLELAKKAV